MSNFFVDGKEESIKEIFNKKQIYSLVTFTNKYPNLINFNYGEKRLYGRTNRYFEPIVPNEMFLKLKNFGSSNPNQVKAFNFVVDAFTDLQNKFKIKAARGEINTNDLFLSDLVPTAGYFDPFVAYEKFTQAFIVAVGEILADKQRTYANFDEFLNLILPYVKNRIKSRPITFPGYVKSAECPINASGLVVEIAKIDPNDDKFKYDNFYSSDNWEFFVNACNTYGFMVDLNMPNRLIADIASPNIQQKMMNYVPEINSADKLIGYNYTPASLIGFDKFQKLLYRTYNANKSKVVLRSVNNHPDGTKTRVRKVKNYTMEEFANEIGIEKLIKLYCEIRFLEDENEFNEHQVHMITTETIQIAAMQNLETALAFFEKIINKPFDYAGSLSYIKQREELLRR